MLQESDVVIIMLKWILVLGLTVGGVMAQTATTLPSYYSKTLSNGLEVVAIPLGKTGVITTDIFYKVGSRNERMGKSGIAHMLEHLNFKSTKNLKAGEFDEIVKGFGGVNNASTGFDYTHYFIKSSRQNMGKSLELFAELMQHLTLSDEEFQPERAVVAEERRWRTDNSPMGKLYFRLFNTAFVYHPYHWTPIGFMNDIQTWTIEDIKSFHSRFYRPSNAIVVVAGDVDPQELFKESEHYFGSIVDHKEALKAQPMSEPEQDGARRAVVYHDTQSQMLAIAYKIPAYDHEDQPALGALAEMLSSGKSSRLQRVLVDQKRLCNQIHAYPMDLSDTGLFIVLAVANPGVDVSEIEKEILKELDKLKKKVNPDELEKVKLHTKSDFIFALESSSSVADLYGSYLARGNLAPLMGYEQAISELTTEKIQNVAKRYFDHHRSTTIILKKEDK